MSAASPLSMRLLFVSGKGGVGKTTISAALALAASKRGKRVLLVEVGPQENFFRLLGAKPGGHSENPVAENIWALNLDPYQALEEYLETQLHSRRLVRMIARNPLFKQLVEVAPGFRDLITLGKIGTWRTSATRKRTAHVTTSSSLTPRPRARGSRSCRRPTLSCAPSASGPHERTASGSEI